MLSEVVEIFFYRHLQRQRHRTLFDSLQSELIRACHAHVEQYDTLLALYRAHNRVADWIVNL